MITEWKSNDFVYTGNSVKNRPAEIINGYLGQKQMDYSEYLQSKYILGYFDGLISEQEINFKYPGALDRVYNVNPEISLTDYLSGLRSTIQNYEKNINRIDLNNDLISLLNINLYNTVNNIIQGFYDNIKNGQFLDYPNNQDSEHKFYYGNIESGYLNENDMR